MSSIQYKRVLLKLSGEALLGESDCGIDPDLLTRLAQELCELRDDGVELGLVIGGGNLFRGAQLAERGMDRVTGDHMGMLATVMNALAMRDTLDRMQVPCKVMSAIPMEVVCEAYNPVQARAYLASGTVVIFAAGTGNPFFTTDSAASLRAIEIHADAMVKATKVDGIYSADPMLDSSATLYEKLTYQDAIDQELKVMDITAMVLCRDHNMPLVVLNMGEHGNLKRFVQGAAVGTLVESGKNMIDEILRDARTRMGKSVDALKQELTKVRTGRAHPSLLNHLNVDYYGNETPLNQVANVAVEDSRTLSITPWEKTMVQAIEKAIMKSELGLTPSTSGTVIRIAMPPLTEERRKDLIKVVRHEAEGARIAIRNIRRDANSDLKDLLKEKEISEDAERKAQDDVQKLTDQFIKDVEKVLVVKEEELMEI